MKRREVYIRNHAGTYGDEALARALGASESSVARTRAKLNLPAPAGPKTAATSGEVDVPPAYTAQAPLPTVFAALSRLDAAGALLCMGLSLLVYLSTLPPGVTGEDSGELIAAAYTLGVAHPPGYPLWCILGKVFTYLPWGTVAWRVALLSAFLGAVTVGLVYLTATKLSGTRSGGVAAAIAMAFSREFWEQSAIAEVYTLNLALLVSCVLFLLLWYENRNDRWLYAFAVSFGLGLCNHHTMALLGPVFVAFVLYVEPRFWVRWRLYAVCTVLSLACLALYLYLPIRSLADPPIDWGNPESWNALKDHVLRRQYAAGEPRPPRSLIRFGAQFAAFLKNYTAEFTPWFSWVPILGAWALWRRSRPTAVFLGAIAACGSIVLILILNYRIDRESMWVNNVFWLPAYMVAALCMGMAVPLCTGRSYAVRRLSSAILFMAVLGTVLLFSNFRFCDKSSYYFASDYATNLLDTMEERAIYFPTADHATFPVLYAVYVEGMREDITVANKYGYPEQSLYKDMRPDSRQDMRAIPTEEQERLIEDWIITSTDRPIYFTKRRSMRGLPGYRLENSGLTYRVLRPGEEPSDRDYWGEYTWHTLEPQETRGELTADFILGDVYYCRGRDYLAEGARDKAWSAFATATAVGGDNKEMLNNMGSAAAEYGAPEKALPYFRQALEIDPRYATALRNTGKCYMALGDSEQALLRFEELLREDPMDVESARRSAECMRRIGWVDDALDRYEYLANLTPEDPEVYLTLAKLRLEEGRETERAALLLEKALKLDPTLQEARRLLDAATAAGGIPNPDELFPRLPGVSPGAGPPQPDLNLPTSGLPSPAGQPPSSGLPVALP